MALLAVSLLVFACTGDASPGTDVTGKPPTAAEKLGLVVPTTYQQACAFADGFCTPGITGSIPTELKRPLHLPAVGPSGRCPASRALPTTTPFMSGALLGNGSVQPLIANRVTRRGTATLGTPANWPRWRALKIVWMSLPSYRGPVVVRGTRLDGRGLLGFGTAPRPGPLVAPPGASMNGFAGYRSWPDTAWVRNPGCYGWQVDGLGFSETIVVRAVLPGHMKI
ncbi:MAG: hypothetical protein QOD46_1314 [Actinomycetota bacterium]|nr:hypothetical protein [Actinomycetota bacterium]